MRSPESAASTPKLQHQPATLVFNSGKPVLYVSEFSDCAIVCDPQHDRLMRLNPTAIAMWKLLASGRSADAVITEISQRFNVEPARVAADLHLLRQQISQCNLRADCYLLTNAATENKQTREDGPPHSLTSAPDRPIKPPFLMILWALTALVIFDLVLSLLSVERLFAIIASWGTKPLPYDRTTTDTICAAVERACIWYPKRALCLQRSAITTCLLRGKGIAAHLVIGARPVPFLAHAWVEVDGVVVNDFPRVSCFYPTLARL
jgi:hypothetical protein